METPQIRVFDKFLCAFSTQVKNPQIVKLGHVKSCFFEFFSRLILSNKTFIFCVDAFKDG